MKKNIIVILIILLITCVACNRHIVVGSKNIVTEDRHLPYYSQIEAAGTYDLELIQGTVGNIQIKAPDNVLPLLQAEVRNGLLYLSQDNQSEIKARVIVYVPLDEQLSSVISKGVCDIRGEVNTKSLALEVLGAGDIEVKGTVQDLMVSVKGAGDAKIQNLIAEKASLRVLGGDISAYVTKEVEASVAGAGDISIY